jgi:hypothetical protein
MIWLDGEVQQANEGSNLFADVLSVCLNCLRDAGALMAKNLLLEFSCLLENLRFTIRVPWARRILISNDQVGRMRPGVVS